MSKNDEYIFLQEVEQLVPELLKKFQWFGRYVQSSNLEFIWSRAYQTYYGNSIDSDYSIGRAGEQGEFSTITINHARNLIKHIKSIVTQNRVNFDTIAENSDLSARNATIVGNAVLDQLFYEKRYEDKLVQMLELGLIMGTSFLLAEWKPNSKLVDVGPQGEPVWAGDTNLKVLSPFDVILEPFKFEFDSQNWIVTREMENKFDLAAVYAVGNEELFDKIVNLPKIKDIQSYTKFYEKDEHTVYVYKMFHKPTPAMPQGRMVIFCDDNLVLLDDVNPYGQLPVFCFRPDVRYGGAYGHTPLFDLMPVQDAINLLDSAALTIADNYSIPNIVVSKASNLQATELSGGLRIIEIDPDAEFPNGGMPTPMPMPQIGNDMANLRNTYVADQERISGINQVMRGASAQTPMSGTAIALSANMSQVYNSSVEREYINVVEQVAYFLLQLLNRFQSYEELLTDTGVANAFAVKSFKGDDLKGIRRVRIHLGNQLAKTLAGRMTIADSLLQNQMLTSEEYLEIIRTGNMHKQVEAKTVEPGYIQLENEMLAQGQKPIMNALDNHIKHIKEHKALLFRPEIRESSTVLGLVLEHITEHTDQLLSMSVNNPTFLTIALDMPIQLPQPKPTTGVGSPPPPPEAPNAEGGPIPEALTSGQQGEAEVQNTAESGQQRADKLMAQVQANNPRGQ